MAALTPLAVWEVRPATGNAANGGMFKTGASGTDYSQQTSPQYTLTGLTSVGAGSVILTASAAADMVGNGINVSAGTNFNTGIFEITAVSVGVSITVSTNAAGQAITTGAGAAGAGKIGGALAAVSTAIASAVAGNQIYLKGTYTTSSVQTMPTTVRDNDFLTPFTINGYLTTRDDGTRATWTTATNSISLLDLSGAFNLQVKNINFTNTAGTKGTGTNGAALISNANSLNTGQLIVSQCSFDGFNIAISGDFANIAWTFVNLQLDCVEIKNSVSHGVITTGSTIATGCWFHANGGDGFRIISGGGNGAYNYTFNFTNCVFYLNGGNGLTNLSDQVALTTVAGNVMIGLAYCAFVSNTGDGVRSPANASGATTAWNNIFWNNTGFGYNSPTSNALVNSVPRCNAYGSNNPGGGGVNRRNFPVGTGDISLSADPFTNKSGGDFSLNSTAGGGTACKGAGFGAFVFGTGHADIGAVQSSGTTTTNVFSPASNIFIFDTEEG